MYEYNICNHCDDDLFRKQCQAIENSIDGLENIETLIDVDGTSAKVYRSENGTITVKNDVQVDALYVVSEFDLLPYFGGKR